LAVRGTETFGPVSIGAAAGVEREDHWTGRDVLAREVLRARLDGKIRLGSAVDLAFETGVYQSGGNFYSTMGVVDMDRILAGYGRARLDLDQLMVQATFERTDFSAEMGTQLHYPDPNPLLATPSSFSSTE
jgi:hypothetical protein